MSIIFVLSQDYLIQSAMHWLKRCTKKTDINIKEKDKILFKSQELVLQIDLYQINLFIIWVELINQDQLSK